MNTRELETVKNFLKPALDAGLLTQDTWREIVALGKTSSVVTSRKEDRLLRPDEAAKILGLCRRTLDSFAAQGKLNKIILCAPHSRKDGRLVGGRCGYRFSELQSLIAGGGK